MKFEILTKLPKQLNGRYYNWDKIIGSKITVKYNDIEYDLFIHKKEQQNLFISLYDNLDNVVKTHCTNFLSGHIGNILGQINYKYKYNVGDIIITKTGKIEILEQIRIQRTNGTTRGYKYECLIDGNIDTIDEDGLYNRNQGCNVCSNHKILKGINDISTTHPNLIKYFKNIEDTYKYSFGSGKKALMQCPDCGFEKLMTISDLSTYDYFSCPKCGDKISIPQKIMFNVLEQLQIDFEVEKVFDWCKYVFKNKFKQGRYDFYFKLDNKEYIIETDGDWHTKDNNRSGQTAKQSKEIDDYKDKLAKEYIIEVIRIDCKLSDLEYIKQNIIKSNLAKLFDLSKIDWLEVQNFIKSSRIIEACNYYNELLSYDKIADKMKISNQTLMKYLKIGSNLNLCGYKTQYELGQEHFVQAIDLWNSGIKSTVKIGNKLNMHYTSIINILNKGKEQNLCDYVPILGYQEKYTINN